MIDATEAHRIGLVNHVCSPDELRDFTLNMARTIGSKSSMVLGVGKTAIRAALDVGLTEGIGVELEHFSNLFGSKDQIIGVNAFINRETAEWQHE